jgi:hypothetical protein
MFFVRGEEQTYVKRLMCFTKKKCCGIPRIRIIKINTEGMMHSSIAVDLQIEKAEVENKMSCQSKEN